MTGQNILDVLGIRIKIDLFRYIYGKRIITKTGNFVPHFSLLRKAPPPPLRRRRLLTSVPVKAPWQSRVTGR
jgi:hypothetical protein